MIAQGSLGDTLQAQRFDPPEPGILSLYSSTSCIACRRRAGKEVPGLNQAQGGLGDTLQAQRFDPPEPRLPYLYKFY